MTELDDLTSPQRLLLKRAWTATRSHPWWPYGEKSAANGPPRYATSASATVSRGGARPKSGGRKLDGVTWDEVPRHLAPSKAARKLPLKSTLNVR